MVLPKNEIATKNENNTHDIQKSPPLIFIKNQRNEDGFKVDELKAGLRPISHGQRQNENWENNGSNQTREKIVFKKMKKKRKGKEADANDFNNIISSIQIS